MMHGNVLITGASSGFGRLIAITLAHAGHRVFAGMRAIGSRNAKIAAELAQLAAPGHITSVELDVTDQASVSSAVSFVVQTAGHIDVLINCAGVMWLGNAEAYSVAQLEAMLSDHALVAEDAEG